MQDMAKIKRNPVAEAIANKAIRLKYTNKGLFVIIS